MRKWRWIAVAVCTLYLSVGVLLSATHRHTGTGLHTDQQCAACAWHHTAVDLPIVQPRVCAPEPVRTSGPGFALSFSNGILGVHPSRGPPQFLQVDLMVSWS